MVPVKKRVARGTTKIILYKLIEGLSDGEAPGLEKTSVLMGLTRFCDVRIVEVSRAGQEKFRQGVLKCVVWVF